MCVCVCACVCVCIYALYIIVEVLRSFEREFVVFGVCVDRSLERKRDDNNSDDDESDESDVW